MAELSCVFTDLDGTLLHSDRTLDPRDLRTIRILQGKGIPVIIATGRHHTIARPIYEQVGGAIPAVTCNGATIYDYEAGRSLMDVCLTTEAVAEVCGYAQEAGLKYYIFTPEKSYYDPDDTRLDFRKGATFLCPNSRVEFHSMAELGDPTAHRVVKIILPGVGDEALAAFRSALGHRKDIELTFSGVGLLEVNFAGVTKGSAVQWLALRRGLDLSRALSLGDNLNDLAMVQTTGFSAAPANAVAEIKAAASVQVPDNEHCRLSCAVEALFPGLLEESTTGR